MTVKEIITPWEFVFSDLSVLDWEPVGTIRNFRRGRLDAAERQTEAVE
jgi:hypothetical protein